MRLTKQTSYALRILIHCALSGGKHVKAADIAAEQITLEIAGLCAACRPAKAT